MFDFFQKIIDFLNELIARYNYSDLEELFFISQIVAVVKAVLQWIKDIGFAPLGYAWMFPLTFYFLFVEYKRRGKGGIL